LEEAEEQHEETNVATRVFAATASVLAGAALSYFLFDFTEAAGQGLHQWYVAIVAFALFANIGVSALLFSGSDNIIAFDSFRRGNQLDVALLILGGGFVVATLLGERGNLYALVGFWFMVCLSYVRSLLLKRGWVRGEQAPEPAVRACLLVAGLSFLLFLASIGIGIDVTQKSDRLYNVSFELWFAIWFFGETLLSLYSVWKATKKAK